jgi:4'-phosphopantetheinyl transferase N-terminal domain
MIEQLLPAGVVAVEAFEDVLGEPVFPGEEDLVANAVEGRRREFVTARHCAREALAKLGHAPVPIRSSSEPVRGRLTQAARSSAFSAAKRAASSASDSSSTLPAWSVSVRWIGLPSIVSRMNAVVTLSPSSASMGRQEGRLREARSLSSVSCTQYRRSCRHRSAHSPRASSSRHLLPNPQRGRK